MFKLSCVSLLALGAVALPTGGAAAAVAGNPAACRSDAGQPAVLVRVEGFKARTGTLRVQIYGGKPADFLAKGRKLSRVDTPVTPAGPIAVCVPVPQPGNYAVAVRHDLDGDGKSGWNDGGGFSRNPRLSLTSLKPDYDEVVVSVGGHARPLDIRLNYRQGLSIKPIRTAQR